MNPWENSSSPEEPTHDPEVQQWFQGLRQPPMQQMPPYLQAKVRARILHSQTRTGLGSWVSRFGHPVWATAVTAVLVLSLGANIWWGLGGQAGEAPVAASESRALTVYPLQSQLPHTEALQAEVTARATTKPEWIGRGFASRQDRRVAFFRVGTIYAEVLAALYSQASDVASERLRLLTEILGQSQAPAILSSYLQEIATWMQSSTYTEADQTQLLALFEPLYVTVYNQQGNPDAVALFQLAAWLENMALAAATQEHKLNQQPAVLQTYHDALIRLQAPARALEAFSQIRALADKPDLTQAERNQIRHLVQTIQHILGTMPG